MIILIILLLVLLLPVPIKTSVIYSEKKLDIYLYNLKFKKKKEKKRPSLNKMYLKRKEVLYISKLGINVLRHNSFKPHIKLNINFIYGLDDAANTAKLYGLLNVANPIIYALLGEFFLIKNFDYKVNADFNKSLFKFNMISIIFINLLTILYVIGIFSTKYIIGKRFAKA